MADQITYTPIDDNGNPVTLTPLDYTPPGAVPGSPGMNPLTPSWAVPFAGQPEMGGREAAGRLAGAAGYTATGGIAGLPGVAARIGLGAGQGAIRNGVQGAIEGTLLNALLEGGIPAIGRLAGALPLLKRLLPETKQVTEFQNVKDFSHSPWVGQSVAPDYTQMMIQGPVMARDQGLIPSLIRLQLQQGGAPTVNAGPVSIVTRGREIVTPSRPYLPNQPTLLRALEEYLAGNAMRQQQ